MSGTRSFVDSVFLFVRFVKATSSLVNMGVSHLGVPYFAVLLIRILLFRVLY